ncbi:MAG: DUF4389 domain-containing protein [Gammaproteobacteria bacterium]|jgi:hypothetical protein
MTDKDIKENSSRGDIWLRGGFILIFALIYGISKIVIWSIVLFQFLSSLITGKTNPQLGGFAQTLSIFVYQLLQFIMFNSDEKPFPFSEWPDKDLELKIQKTAAKKKTAKKTTRKKKTVAKNKE